MNPTAQSIQTLIYQHKFREADHLIEQSLEKNPTSTDSLYLKGVSQYFQGKISLAIESLKLTLRNDPRHTDAAICLSVLLNDIGRYQEAKQVFEQANHSVSPFLTNQESEIDLKFAVKHLEIADLYFRYRRYDEAIEEYSKAAILNPTHLETRIRRAKALAKKGYVSRAIQELQQIKLENPRDSTAMLQLGLLQFSNGNILDAELEWESALAVDPENKEARSYLKMASSARIKEK
ncbi:MAG: tetratricopeptide repeat protein [Xanthomonadaceae bacterium]|nr:tetratricopeptide repeat protein [Xanthomonadaceae bacterium]